MSEEKKELKWCSGCKSTMLLEYFKINRKGEYQKTCIQCAKRRKEYNEKNKKKGFKCEECEKVLTSNGHLTLI